MAVAFRDNGHWIRDEHMPNILTPFFTTHEMGTGLGLSVVHNIVTAHGGEISVVSKEGDGAVFTVALPRAPGDRAGVARSSQVVHTA